VKIPHIGLVNVVAGRQVAPEFVQDALKPRDVADALAPTGWLRLGVVSVHGADAAVLFAFAYGDTLALYNAAYDPALGSLSLGIASHAYALRDAIGQGFRVYDLLRGDEPYKHHWRPEPVVNQRLLLARRRTAPLLAATLCDVAARQRGKEAVRAVRKWRERGGGGP
jgi:CelD/BcsL family acetyltransferase involved in cellulose biosynthesis